MRVLYTDRNASHWQRKGNNNRAESAVAVLWLIFYVLALGAGITSPVVSSAIDLGAR